MLTRRNLMGTAAAGATGLVAAARYASAQAPAGESHHAHSEHWKACADACDACAKSCNAMFHHCLGLASAGKAEHGRMAQVAVDCAAFCNLSATMLARNSLLASLSCSACAEACKWCAQECESFTSDQEMKTCAAECRRCEESCRKMVQEASAARSTSATPPGR